jgi:hypothetical protein
MPELPYVGQGKHLYPLFLSNLQTPYVLFAINGFVTFLQERSQRPPTGVGAGRGIGLLFGVGVGSGALRVINQDLESSEDDVTIGDREGNFASINPSLSALNVYITNPSFTKCETKTSGNSSFVSKQILIYNKTNTLSYVSLILSSGMNCEIPVPPSENISLNLEVTSVVDYSGCIINFFA